MDFFKELQKTVANIVNNMKLVDYCVGEVLQLEPLKLNIGDNKIIEDSGTNFYYTENVIEKSIVLTHGHTTSNISHSHTVSNLEHIHSYENGRNTQSGLTEIYNTSTDLSNSYKSSSDMGAFTLTEKINIGDKLLLIKVAQGQKFIILSKIRNKKKVTIDTTGTWDWS